MWFFCWNDLRVFQPVHVQSSDPYAVSHKNHLLPSHHELNIPFFVCVIIYVLPTLKMLCEFDIMLAVSFSLLIWRKIANWMEAKTPCADKLLLKHDWLVCCLLAGPDLWKRILLKFSITMVFTCPLLTWCKISGYFREANNVVVFQFPLYIFMPLANL